MNEKKRLQTVKVIISFRVKIRSNKTLPKRKIMPALAYAKILNMYVKYIFLMENCPSIKLALVIIQKKNLSKFIATFMLTSVAA